MSFGEIIPTTWYSGIYKLETDGTDSSGNGNTLPGLNTPNFAVARFGAGGMNGGTSGVNRGLRHTTLNLASGGALTCVQVGMWFKLNTTSAITATSIFYMVEANSGGANYQMFAWGDISGGNLTIQNALITSPGSVTSSLTVPADLNWHYITFTIDITPITGAKQSTVTYDGKTATATASLAVSGSAVGRVSIGNHTTSSTLQMWGTFDQVTISINGNRLGFFQLQNRQAQARGMFCI